ncbi:hypothetical protein ACHWQZ_G014385 [Mnemiopsis leidyi]
MTPYCCNISIPFPSERLATIAMRSVSADKEPRKSGVTRDMKVCGGVLHVSVSSSELRVLRVSLGSVLELLKLSCDTMDMFDEKS